MAGMVKHRKVRADFDPKQPISVDVSNCTEEEKKEVQQAFYDVGIKWFTHGTEFRYLDAGMYTNSAPTGVCHGNLMCGLSPRADSISHRQFLSMVYESEQQGHVHAELMALYAEDAKTTDKPWELWQVHYTRDVWHNLAGNPNWSSKYKFRRKPKTHIVNGLEVSDLRFDPKKGDRFYLVDPTEPEFTNIYSATNDTMWAERGLCYEPTEEGKKAAIFHAKAWLGEGIYFDSK